MWSVVVSQPSTPGRPSQIRSRRSTRRRRPRAEGRRPPSAEPLQVGDEVAQLGLREVQVGHLVAGLERPASRRSSARRSAGVFGTVSAPSVVREREVRQVRAGDAARARAADRVAVGAGAVQEDPARRAARRRRPAPRRGAPGRRASAGTPPAGRRRRRTPCARAAARRTRRTARGSGRRRRRRARSRWSGRGSCRSSG